MDAEIIEAKPQAAGNNTVKSMSTSQRRFRPLGLVLAILGSVVVLGFAALVPALFILVLTLEGHALKPATPLFWLPPVFGALLIVLSVPAWLGRARWVRVAFLVVAVLTTAVSLYQTFYPTQLGYNNGLSGGSLDGAFQDLALCLVPVRLIVLAYTLWYVNRRPARAFYSAYPSSKPPATPS